MEVGIRANLGFELGDFRKFDSDFESEYEYLFSISENPKRFFAKYFYMQLDIGEDWH